MENQDKIYEQFKQASEHIEQKEFPSMDKVWNRVEEKLDKKVLTKQNNLWKKIAIAASVLLFVTLTYQIFKPEPPIAPKHEVVILESVPPAPQIIPENAVVDAQNANPIIKKDADAILQNQLEKTPVAVAEESVKSDEIHKDADQELETDMVFKSKKASPSVSRPGRFQKGRAFDAIGVRREVSESAAFETDKKSEAKVVGNAQAPLVIVDGKAVTGKDALEINTVKEGIAKVDPKDEKEVVVLKEPLYIINGHYYTEEDLFGPNPTSPYAPLNQQEIETIVVFQGEKAIANYGKKGEKGVVVITTKGRKPASQKSDKPAPEKAK